MSDVRGPAVVAREVGETCRLCRQRLKVGEHIIVFDHNGGPWPVHTGCWDPRSPTIERPTKRPGLLARFWMWLEEEDR